MGKYIYLFIFKTLLDIFVAILFNNLVLHLVIIQSKSSNFFTISKQVTDEAVIAKD